MTTFEHAMVGMNGVLACGLYRRYGWQLAALAGVAAVAPDWDGLTLLYSADLFDRSHRVWGHNLLACSLLGAVIALADLRFDLMTRTAGVISRWVTLPEGLSDSTVRLPRTMLVWISVAVLACLSQLPCDMVVSGTETLADWHLQILWPFSDREFVYPLVPWGDPGMTLILVVGLFSLLRWQARRQMIASLTLLGVAAYIAV